MTDQLAIIDLDCVFLTYDEPKKEEFWVQIKNMVPWAKRVDGVKGSDAAHKAAAAASETDRFILIDGDNLPDAKFFDETLTFNDSNRDCVLRWRARNNINGLVYGNGGISCWTKEFVNKMKTHEATDGRDETVVEFCFDRRYLAMNNCYSTTFPNSTPGQAWRAGFREGVKMCLDRGRRPTATEFTVMQSQMNSEYLNIWHTVGADAANGFWATYGARLGTHMVMLNPNWDYTEVQSFDALDKVWKNISIQGPAEARKHCSQISEELRKKLSLKIVDMDADQSEFFKKYYTRLHRNRDIMSQ